MQDLRVALIQTDIYWENVTANLAMLEEKIATLSPKDLIVLPEMFNTGFTANTKLAETMNGHTHKWLKMMAKKTNSTIIGSLLISEKNEYFNRMFCVNPESEVLFYDKRYLFRMSEEANILSKGTNNNVIFKIKGWRICPSICYEIRFPESCRNTILPDHTINYDIIINIANWPNTRKEAWHTLLQARAIENQSYVLGVNRRGNDGNLLQYDGNSCAINPEGNTLNTTDNLDKLLQINLSATYLSEYRKMFPVHLDW
jgi:predicted amidohydrolase